MTKFSGSEEIYKELVEDSDDNWILGLLAFAVIEEQRVEWMRHQEVNNGGLPNSDEIKRWYEEQPENVLLRAKGTAENALKVYSDEVVGIFVDENQKSIEEGIIVSEIRESKALWPQFGINMAGGFASAFLFSFFLAMMAFFILSDSSPIDIGITFGQQLKD
jgi:hypothetical protein